MFNLIRSRTLYHHCGWISSRISAKHEQCFLQNHAFSLSSSSKKILESTTVDCNENSFTISYLMKSCGLSQERAVSASKHVSFESPEKPDSVLAFMKKHGFSDAQVSVVVRKYPRVLLCNPKKIFTPKINFFASVGFSRSEIISLLAKSQNLLFARTEDRIIPNFSKLSDLLNSKDKTETAFCIKRYPDLISRNFYDKVAENIQIFKEAGVPEVSVLGWLKRQPRAFLTSPDKVKDTMEELKKMGFNPQQSRFLKGAYVMMAMNKLRWEEKIEHFKKLGVSEEMVKAAFRSHPWCMASSKEQIQKIMEFFVNEMGFKPVDVIKHPVLFSSSLERSITPRYSVYQVLLSKGLVKKQFFLSIFTCPKTYFLQKFVGCHLQEAPEIQQFVETN